MDTSSDHRRIVAAARSEASRMREAIAREQGSAPVRMSATQFETLALLIERLADCCGAGGQVDECWLDESGRTADEFRSWVPLQHLAAARRHVVTCQAEVVEARSQLAAREAENVRLTSLAFGLQPAC